MEVLKKQADQSEQYGRRTFLQISGVPETENENTGDIVMKLVADIGTDITVEEIDQSLRIGNPKRKGANSRKKNCKTCPSIELGKNI